MDLRLKYITTQEAARILDYDDSHVRRLLIEGKLKGDKWGNTWMVDLEDCMEWRKTRIYQRSGKPKSGGIQNPPERD